MGAREVLGSTAGTEVAIFFIVPSSPTQPLADTAMSQMTATGSKRRALTGAAILALSSYALAPLAVAQDLIVPSGSTVVYNTGVSGPIAVNRFAIEPNANFVVIGSAPLKISAVTVEIDGSLFANGLNSQNVIGLNVTNVPELGALGAAGGGNGGTASVNTTASTPAGLPGDESYGTLFPGIALGGGGGGETSFAPNGANARENRRGAGGGGGALAANQPVSAEPFADENIGLAAQQGMGGGPDGTGAISGNMRAAGGLPGLPFFQDSNPNNDFWGIKPSPLGNIIGEARRPLPGRGGGGGGDAVSSATFPLNPFLNTGDEKGAGGGGGGGLVLIIARNFRLGPNGRLSANGGNGGAGENVIFFDRVGGGSGGGSGGWIILESGDIDLSNASDASITAIGGRGGAGRNDAFPGGFAGDDIPGAGGNGGPGVIQLHVPSGLEAEIALPPGKNLNDLTLPDAHVLLPKLSN